MKVYLLFLALLMVQSNGTENYFQKYQKDVNKIIKKEFDLKEDFVLELESKPKEAHVDPEIGVFSQVRKGDEVRGYVYLNSVKSCSIGGCTAEAYGSNEAKNHEFFDVAVVLDADKLIKKVKVLNYYSDYGYEVTSKRYLKKYKGLKPCTFSSGVEIDAVSGATISCYSLMDEMEKLCVYL